jgi:hypothetical protein
VNIRAAGAAANLSKSSPRRTSVLLKKKSALLFASLRSPSVLLAKPPLARKAAGDVVSLLREEALAER